MNTNSLAKSEAALQRAGIATARLDALVLLEDLTGKDRSWLLAHPEYALTPAQQSKLNQQIERRAKHEPLAYVRGKTEFYGREFAVSAHTLEPRPETETMIDLLKQLWHPGMSMLDVGTGSGAIGITVALELNTAVDLIDIDAETLKIAKNNVAKYKLRLNCSKSDLLKSTKKSYDVLLANLPYVPDSHTINQAAMQEPKHAIFGGKDGLDLYRQLFEQANKKPAYILTESLPFQHDELAKIAAKHGYKQLKQEGFIQVFGLRE